MYYHGGEIQRAIIMSFIEVIYMGDVSYFFEFCRHDGLNTFSVKKG